MMTGERQKKKTANVICLLLQSLEYSVFEFEYLYTLYDHFIMEIAMTIKLPGGVGGIYVKYLSKRQSEGHREQDVLVLVKHFRCSQRRHCHSVENMDITSRQ